MDVSAGGWMMVAARGQLPCDVVPGSRDASRIGRSPPVFSTGKRIAGPREEPGVVVSIEGDYRPASSTSTTLPSVI